MKISFLVLTTVISFALGASGAQPDLRLNKETARNAITEFRAHPLSPRGRAAAQMVRDFAEKDDSVLLKVTEKLVPFLSNLKLTPEDRALLLAAYVVGNVDSQLLHHEKKDDPYAGVLEVIETYRKMKVKDPMLVLPEIENFIDLQNKGELKEYAESQ